MYSVITLYFCPYLKKWNILNSNAETRLKLFPHSVCLKKVKQFIGGKTQLLASFQKKTGKKVKNTTQDKPYFIEDNQTVIYMIFLYTIYIYDLLFFYSQLQNHIKNISPLTEFAQ